MPTYAETAHRREIASRRRVQDARDAARHRAFDLQAQDRTAKFERPRFAVVGEGSHSAQEAYRQNYARIFRLPSRPPLPPSASSHGAPVTAG
jgi:erythromycin esterase-like protein